MNQKADISPFGHAVQQLATALLSNQSPAKRLPDHKPYTPADGTHRQVTLDYLGKNPRAKVSAISQGTGLPVETLYVVLQELQRSGRITGSVYSGNKKLWSCA